MECRFSAADGVQLLLRLPVICQTCTLSLFSSCGRILAEDISARLPVPPFARSPYDGYAFRSADTVSASPEHPAVLRILEELPAGTVPTLPVTEGTAAKILTGAPVPPGADTIVKYEETAFTSNTVSLFSPYTPRNIVPIGEDVTVGTVLARRGTLITGPLMGTLAGQGISSVQVYRRPVVSIISTGSELVQVGSSLPDGKIYGTNLYTLGGLLRDLGVEVLDGGTVADNPDIISTRIVRELGAADMVITTGGASVGDYDYTRAATLQAGAKILFKKLAFKPGGSMMAGVKNGKVILGLSGNPGAAAIGLLRVASPYIRKLCGRSDLFYEEIQVLLKRPVDKASPQMRFLRGRLAVENGAAFFLENRSQKNGSISSLLQCDLLAEISAGSPPLDAGTMVKAYRITT